MLNKIKLKNFKKFQQGEFQFHTGTNILIGANDAGKSTILKAIDIVLSQTGTDDWRNRSAYGTLMNNQAIQTFLSSDKSVANLPKIQIEAWLDLGTDLNNAKFEGMNNSKQKQAQGVLFEYMFDEQFTIDFDQMVAESGDEMSFIPFEFYKATWRTFSTMIRRLVILSQHIQINYSERCPLAIETVSGLHLKKHSHKYLLLPYLLKTA